MGFLKRMATILGFLHGNGDAGDGAEDEDRVAGRDEPRRSASFSSSATPGVRRGFSVQVPVAAERSHLGSVLVPCDHEEGGVQVRSIAFLYGGGFTCDCSSCCV